MLFAVFVFGLTFGLLYFGTEACWRRIKRSEKKWAKRLVKLDEDLSKAGTMASIVMFAFFVAFCVFLSVLDGVNGGDYITGIINGAISCSFAVCLLVDIRDYRRARKKVSSPEKDTAE